LQVVSSPENSTGIGLANLNERYKILMGREIEIIKTDEYFIVKLPLEA
jgi:two-component system, LytTR family, sensor kinase